MSDHAFTPESFITHWQKAEANERANSQSFLIGLAHLLGVPAPTNSHATGYSFEFPVKVPGTSSTNFIDLYRRGHFVLESKQFTPQKEEQSHLELVAIKAGTVEEKKKSGPVRGTGLWDDAMLRAKGQAERYVRYLPTDEPNPPFIIVCDVGHSLEVYADFTQNGKAYLPFPDPRTFRIKLADLAHEDVRERLHLIWTNPSALDPTKISADVTREIAGYLAELAKSLEQQQHDPEVVAQFLTRCLFCMFAEDVGLLPPRAFTDLLNSLPGDGTGFVSTVRTLFREMNTGTKGDISVVLRQKLLRFNGGLFADDTVLPVNGLQLGLLKQAARTNWRNVEPAIFGTLLERALVPEERHALGAHFTPRAYVERLVLPTLMDPLRQEWEHVRAAAVMLAMRSELKSANAEVKRASSKLKQAAGDLPGAKDDFKAAGDEDKSAQADLRTARQQVNAFLEKLCQTTVLDPACGSGNFLYVALEHMKRLEGEVIDLATQLGVDQRLDLSTHTVDPHQFLGIEVNPRAAAIAEMVLWIGYLQWHFRTRGQTPPDEPILKSFKNIQCRDAVLAYDGEPQSVLDEAGTPRTVWDRHSYKTDLITNRNVPDESQRVPLLTYANPRPAEWPRADYIVGNPPFIGKVRLREDLGDGYAETLRAAYPAVPESADFVLYWWHKAAELVRMGKVRRFGLITTNSLRQTFARRVVQHHLSGATAQGSARVSRAASGVSPDASGLSQGEGGNAVRGRSSSQRDAETDTRDACAPLSLSFAIPDHPWVDTAEGAAVRIAMTVGVAGTQEGELLEVIDEQPHDDGSAVVKFGTVMRGKIFADLTVGSDVAGARPLKANDGMTSMGVMLAGRGFIIEEEEARALGAGTDHSLDAVLRPLRNGKDLTEGPRHMWVIDFTGLSVDDARALYPALYQILLTRVKPERDANRDAQFREKWWLFGRSRPEMRALTNGLKRYIATVETAKHRVFQFLDSNTLPEHKLVMFGSDDAFHLGVVSSRIHVNWALAQGAMLEDRPVYPKTQCFDPFPFPLCAEEQKERIRSIAEELDAHRKRVQAQHLGLTLTGMYNVLEKLRSDQPLTDKERDIHDKGLVSLLQQLHDDLDAAVFAAYGWPTALTDADILQRLVTLNAQRSAEEKQGIIHWLRPEYQSKTGTTEQGELTLPKGKAGKPLAPPLRSPRAKSSSAKTAWPKPLADRIRATEHALHAAGHPVTAEELTRRFARAKPADLQEILDSLVTLGRAHRSGEKFSV